MISLRDTYERSFYEKLHTSLTLLLVELICHNWQVVLFLSHDVAEPVRKEPYFLQEITKSKAQRAPQIGGPQGSKSSDEVTNSQSQCDQENKKKVKISENEDNKKVVVVNEEESVVELKDVEDVVEMSYHDFIDHLDALESIYLFRMKISESVEEVTSDEAIEQLTEIEELFKEKFAREDRCRAYLEADTEEEEDKIECLQQSVTFQPGRVVVSCECLVEDSQLVQTSLDANIDWLLGDSFEPQGVEDEVNYVVDLPKTKREFKDLVRRADVQSFGEGPTTCIFVRGNPILRVKNWNGKLFGHDGLFYRVPKDFQKRNYVKPIGVGPVNLRSVNRFVGLDFWEDESPGDQACAFVPHVKTRKTRTRVVPDYVRNNACWFKEFKYPPSVERWTKPREGKARDNLVNYLFRRLRHLPTKDLYTCLMTRSKTNCFCLSSGGQLRVAYLEAILDKNLCVEVWHKILKTKLRRQGADVSKAQCEFKWSLDWEQEFILSNSDKNVKEYSKRKEVYEALHIPLVEVDQCHEFGLVPPPVIGEGYWSKAWEESYLLYCSEVERSDFYYNKEELLAEGRDLSEVRLARLTMQQPVLGKDDDYVTAAKDIFKAFSGTLPDWCTLDLFISFFGLITTKETTSAIAFGVIFIRKLPLKHLVEALVNDFVKVFQWLTRSVVEIQGVQDVDSDVKMLRKSPLSVKIITALTSVVGLMAFGEKTALKSSFILAMWNHIAEVFETFSTPFELLVDLGSFVEEHYKHYQVTGEWRDLFGRSREQELYEKLRRLSDEITNARFNQVDPHDLIQRCRNTILKTAGSRDPLVVKRASELHESVTRFSRGLCNERTAPVGFIVTGPPGCGKTYLTGTVAKILGAMKKVPSDVSLTHFWSNTDHQILPAIVRLLVVNDAFQTKDEKANYSIIELLQQLVDTSPMATPAASIPDKADSYIAPDIVMVTTNVRNYFASNATGLVNRLDRRYEIIECMWTPLCYRLAEEAELTTDEYFKLHPHDVGLVSYKIGKMCNTRERTVDMTPKLHIKELPDFHSVLKYIFVREKERMASGQEDVRLCASCGFLEGPGCFCLEEQGNTGSIRIEHVHTVPEEMQKKIDAFATTFGEKTESIMSTTAKIRDFTYYFGGFIASFAVLKLLGFAAKEMYLRFNPQGMVQSTPSFPKESGYVEPMHSTTASWLGAGSDIPSMEAWYGGVMRMHCLLVMHKLITIPVHFFYTEVGGTWRHAKGSTFTLKYRGIVHEVSFNEEWCVVGDKEECYYYIPNVPGVATVAYHKLPEVFSAPTEPCTMPGYEVPCKTFFVHSPTEYGYFIPTVRGDCGLPLVGASGTIYSAHWGGLVSRGLGVGYALSKARVRAIMKVFESRGITLFEMTNDLTPELQGLEPGLHPRSDASWFQKENPDFIKTNHIVVGHRKSADNSKMSCRETKLFPKVKDKLTKLYCKPHEGKAVKDPVTGEWNSPVVKRLKAARQNCLVDHTKMMKAVDLVLADMPVPEKPLEPLSDYDTLCGSERSVLINGKDVTKAVGPTLADKKLSKNVVFKKLKEGEYELHPEAKRLIAEVEAEVKGEGPLNPVRVKATKKDEVYPKDKADKGMYRFFYVSDYADNHNMRKYLLPLLNQLMKHPRKSGCVVTMNAASEQWKEMIKYLTKFGEESTIDADQDAYDMRHSTMCEYYRFFMRNFAKKCGYTPEQVRIVDRILAKTQRYFLDMEGNTFLCFQSLNSGRPDTIIYNCMVLKIMCYYCYLMAGFDDPVEHLRMACTGDDLILSTDNENFGGVELEKGFTQLGYLITDGNKDPVISKKSIFVIPYLKRTTTMLYRGALAENSIWKSLAYVTGVSIDSEDERNQNAISCAVREFFLHGREVFEREKVFLEELAQRSFPSYDEMEEEYAKNLFQTWIPNAGNCIPLASDGIVVADLVPFDHSTTVGCEKLKELDFMESIEPQGVIDKGIVTPTLTSFSSSVSESAAGAPPSMGDPATDNLSLNPTANTTPATLPTNKVTEVTMMSTTGVVGHDATSMVHRDTLSAVSLKDYFKRPRAVATFNADTGGTFLLWESWRTIPSVERFVDKWNLVRCKPTLYINYTGGSQFIGKVRVYALPDLNSIENDSTTADRLALNYPHITALDTFTYTSQVPHVDIDLSIAETPTMTLPFPHAQQFMNRTSNDWTIVVAPINPPLLANGSTPPNILITVLVSYEVDLQVIIPQGIEAPSGVISNGLDYANMLAGRVKGFISNFERFTSLNSAFAKSIGWTRPNVESQNQIVTRHVSSMGTASGAPQFSMSLALDPAVSRNTDHSRFPLGEEGDTSITSIVRRWAQIANSIEPTNIFGIQPMMSHFPDATSTFYTTPLGFVCGAFEYWTGSIELRFEVMSSPLIRWRLGIAIVPPGRPVPITFPYDGDYITHIVECVGTTIFDFEVPYLYSNNFQRLHGFSPFDDPDIDLTRVVYFSLTLPTGPSATPIFPYINVYVRAGHSFSLGVPSLRNVQAIEVQGIGEPSEATFGEVVDDIRLLCRRPTFWCQLLGTGPRYVFPQCPTVPFGNFTVNDLSFNRQRWVFETWFGIAYMGSSGGAEFKFNPITNTLVDVTTVWAVPEANNGDSLDGGRGGMVFDKRHFQLSEVSIPDRNFSTFRRTACIMDGFTPIECVQLTSEVSAEPLGLVDVWYSSRDDFTLGGFLGVPRMTL